MQGGGRGGSGTPLPEAQATQEDARPAAAPSSLLEHGAIPAADVDGESHAAGTGAERGGGEDGEEKEEEAGNAAAHFTPVVLGTDQVVADKPTLGARGEEDDIPELSDRLRVRKEGEEEERIACDESRVAHAEEAEQEEGGGAVGGGEGEEEEEEEEEEKGLFKANAVNEEEEEEEEEGLLISNE